MRQQLVKSVKFNETFYLESDPLTPYRLTPKNARKKDDITEVCIASTIYDTHQWIDWNTKVVVA